MLNIRAATGMGGLVAVTTILALTQIISRLASTLAA